jgi:hypothetical protein
MTDPADVTPWVPAFPGQRPPFTEGNTVALGHGAHSMRVYGPRAAELATAKLAERPDLAPYVEAVGVWATFLARFELEAARDEPNLYWLARFGTAALRAGAALGLDPTAEARLTRDRAAAAAMTVASAVDLDALAARGQQALDARAAGAIERASADHDDPDPDPDPDPDQQE